MRINKSLLAALAATLTLGSCTDFINGFDENAHAYQENFVKEFGQIDPNQDWSMAGRFTADVNLDSKVEGILSVYTKQPGLDGSYLLAKAEVKEGKASVEFDAIKGTDMLYAVVQKNGRNIEASNYDVVNGHINIGKLATRALETTAEQDNVSITPHTLQVKINENIIDQTPWRMTKAAVAALVTSGEDSYSKLDGNYATSTGTSPNQKNAIAYENLYKINNNHEEHGAEYTMEQLWKIFGKKKSGGTTEFEIEGVFQEGTDHIEKYVKTGILERDASLVVSEDGPVSMELIWRGTDYYDVFGYFFYPEDGTPLTAEYLWSTNKYILFGDDLNRSVGGWSNLTQVSHWNDALNNGAGGYGDWLDLSGMLAQNTALGQYGSGKTKMRGTKMWLVNFNADGTPTYEFKKGTKLGFFLYTPHINQIVFSDTKLNYQLNYLPYKDGVSGTEDNDQARPYAVTFDYKGSTLLGFADGCNDYDLNDVVFGAFNVEPSKDIPDPDPDPEAITWMVACEDLGGTFDYDFNDLVFGLRKTPNLDVTKSKVELIPYAAGGTLEAHIVYDNNGTEEDKGEIHKLVGGPSASTSTPLNVGANQRTVTPGEAVTLTNSIESSTSINDIAQNVKVSVSGSAAGNYYLSHSDYGEEKTAPQMILFQAGWDWPSERTDIRDVYPDFADWVANSAHTDWYMNLNETYPYVTSPLAKPTTGGGTGSGEGTGTGSGEGGNTGGDVDNRTPMTVGETYTLIGGSPSDEAVYDIWSNTWNASISEVSCPTYKLPANLTNSTGTIVVTFENAVNFNVDLYDKDKILIGSLTKNDNTTASLSTLTVAQMQSLLSGTTFYIACAQGNTITSVTFKINE